MTGGEGSGPTRSRSAPENLTDPYFAVDEEMDESGATTVTFPPFPPLGNPALTQIPHRRSITVVIPPVPTTLPVLNSPGVPMMTVSTSSSMPQASPPSPTSPSSPEGMSPVHGQPGQDPKGSKKRRRLTSEETRVLATEFDKNPKPNAKTRNKLSVEIPGMTARAVQIWFQNRRQKWKMTKPKRNSGNMSSQPPASEDGTAAPAAGTSKPLSKSSSSSSLNQERRSSSSTPTHTEPPPPQGKHDNMRDRDSKRPALGSGIRRYASDGALVRKEQESAPHFDPDNFWLTIGAGGGGGEQNATPLSSTPTGNFVPTLPENSWNATHKKSSSAPEFDFLHRHEQQQAAYPELENLSLEPTGLEPLFSYAASLVLGKPIIMGGEQIMPPSVGPPNYGMSRHPPPPPPGWNAPPNNHQGNPHRRSGELYPNLGAHLQLYQGGEDDPTHGLRKTRSVPNINQEVPPISVPPPARRPTSLIHTLASSLPAPPPPDELFWASDVDSEYEFSEGVGIDDVLDADNFQGFDPTG